MITIITACAPATPGTLDTGPLIEAIEGTPIALAAFTPGAIQPTPTPALSEVEGEPPRTAVLPPEGTLLVIDGPTITPGGVSVPGATRDSAPSHPETSTPIPTVPPGATRDSAPLPTAKLTLPPTITPRPPAATPSPDRLNPDLPSPTASATRTPTATAAPTQIPTATPRPVCHPATLRPPNAGWSVSRVCVRQEDSDFWFVLGEIRNSTGGARSLVEIEATFFDGNGNVLERDVGGIDAEAIPDGARLPFIVQIVSTSPPAQVGFEISEEPADLTPREGFVVSGLQLTSSGSSLFLTGQVTNPGPALTNYAEVMATFYYRDESVVALGYASLSADELGPSATASFEIEAFGLIDLVSDYRVVVYGY